MPPSFTVVGEALVDLLIADDGTRVATPGGSPYNVAIGLARLGAAVRLVARAGADEFGALLYEHARASGVDLTSWTCSAEPTSVATVRLDATGQAGYDFDVQATAALRYIAGELPGPEHRADVLHVGSLASWLDPSRQLIAAVQQAAFDGGRTLVTYDPNVRPGLLISSARAVDLVETSVAAAHLVKASDADARWLYPGSSLAAMARRWLELGPSVVVITNGANGATVFPRSGRPVRRPGLPVTVSDTIGAGDAFTAGLLSALADAGCSAPAAFEAATPSFLGWAVDRATAVAAMTCERPGADPPTRIEVDRRFPAPPPGRGGKYG